MYAYFIGRVAYTYGDRIIIETGGIGYNIFMPASDLAMISTGEELKVFTYTSVREDAIVLYGFLDMHELDFFKLLLTVNGVGPKAAMNILGSTSVDNLQVAIIAQDTKALSKVPGIGAKTAGRIILDLKDKVSSTDILESITDSGDNKTANAYGILKSEACEALTSLGYSASEAMRAINRVEISEGDRVEDIIRLALIQL